MSDYEHKPVMVAEVLEALHPAPNGSFVDGTIGGGGHAAAILSATAPNGWLYGCDRDGDAVEVARQRLAAFAPRVDIRQQNFCELAGWIPADSCDGVLLDLGMSSPQLDRGERGFSFQQEGPLDMRMDQRQEITAARLVNELPGEELARIFWEYGDERNSRRLANAIARAREGQLFSTTRQLASLIESVAPRLGKKKHPATQVFQALRIAVNDEIRSLHQGLEGAVQILRRGGRLAVITFHSLEDRMVKEFGRRWARDYEVPGTVDVPELRVPRTPRLRMVNRKAILPGERELNENPRSRSAQLRVFEKT